MSKNQITHELQPAAVQIPVSGLILHGELAIPASANRIVVFAHGSGSSRHSPRNQYVARALRDSGCGTLLFDLLTNEEEMEDSITARLRFDIGLLAIRLVQATEWLLATPATREMGIGYFGSSTGGAAALVAAAEIGSRVDAVVSRGGRPDLAGDWLARVHSPTLLIVGGRDDVVIRLNESAWANLQCKKELRIIPRATHLFEEPGALKKVAHLAIDWFGRHLRLHAHAVE